MKILNFHFNHLTGFIKLKYPLKSGQSYEITAMPVNIFDLKDPVISIEKEIWKEVDSFEKRRF